MALSVKARKTLLILARKTLEEEIAGKSELKDESDDFQELAEISGVFVTLTLSGELRGCIGQIYGMLPIREAVREMSMSAALKDPRFSPVSQKELKQIAIEISVLSPLQEVRPEEVIPGVHGVVLSSGHRKSTYLPQVWEQLPDREIFFSSLCHKGGMPASCWKNPGTRIEVYTCEAFSESEFSD